MTAPRQVLPEATYLVTRRVSQRRLMLTPAPLTKGVVKYCFGRAAESYGIELHVLQVLGNHYHAVLTDPEGRLPEFMAWVDREIAKACNAIFARAESFWSSDHYSAVRLCDAESVFGKMLYTFVNVVQAGLVRDYIDWPGVRSTPRDWVRPPEVVRRPEVHFNQKDARWTEVELRFTVPPQFRDRPAEAFAGDVQRAIEERQREIRARRRAAGQTFLGVERVLKTDPMSKPLSKHVKGKLSPTFAAGTPEGQKRARNERAHFLASYREALFKWRHGLECLFPFGAYWLPRFANAPCMNAATAVASMDSG
ncbi:MAG: hypothetical protein OXT09_00600 [Myxococcales bacterium]|nr:hypothetical protein [Myxococcales bacterium]